MGFPPDPLPLTVAARDHRDLLDTVGIWSAQWIQDLRGEQYLDVNDWLLWCVPFVELMMRRPAYVDMLEVMPRRYRERHGDGQRRPITVREVAEESCERAWDHARFARQGFVPPWLASSGGG